MDSEGIGDVESALAAFPGLAGVAVVEHGADEADHCLIAYVAPSGPGLDVPELHAYARKALGHGSMPAAIVVVDEIPATAAGAVDVAALPVPDLSGLLPYRAPTTPRQEILCDLFAEVLGVARCGVDNDFFDLAGRSVEAMVLAGRISTTLGVRISVSHGNEFRLFLHDTAARFLMATSQFAAPNVVSSAFELPEHFPIRLGVSRVREISVAFFFGNTFEKRGDCSPKLLNGARLHFA